MRRGSSMARAAPKLEVVAKLKVADGGGAHAPEMPEEVLRRPMPEQQGGAAGPVPQRQCGARPPSSGASQQGAQRAGT